MARSSAFDVPPASAESATHANPSFMSAEDTDNSYDSYFELRGGLDEASSYTEQYGDSNPRTNIHSASLTCDNCHNDDEKMTVREDMNLPLPRSEPSSFPRCRARPKRRGLQDDDRRGAMAPPRLGLTRRAGGGTGAQITFWTFPGRSAPPPRAESGKLPT